MQRYRERAENIARLIDVNHILNIDLPDSETQWQPILEATADFELFNTFYKKINKENVMNFLTFDIHNPHSIYSCITQARENARSIREIISSETWHEINTLYLFMQKESTNPHALLDPYPFYNRIKRQCQLFNGICDGTWSRGTAWHFSRMGCLLERADMTSRMLDVKYFMLLPSTEQVGTQFDNVQWSALLKSASALEMYRKKWHQINHINVVEFLILDSEFPRSIYHCLMELKDSLEVIKNPIKDFRASNDPCILISDLISRLEVLDGTSVLAVGLHEFLDQIQLKIIEINNNITTSFFESKSKTHESLCV
jgi:uncharacterized alpha-E superfamily protein